MVSSEDIRNDLETHGPSSLGSIVKRLDTNKGQVQKLLLRMLVDNGKRKAPVKRSGERGTYIYELVRREVVIAVSDDPEPKVTVNVRPVMPPVSGPNSVVVPVPRTLELLDAVRQAVAESEYNDGSTVSRKRLLTRLDEIEANLREGNSFRGEPSL